MPIIRTALLIAPLALAACATSSAVKPGAELEAQVRALREDNARLEARLRRLEDAQQVAKAAPRPAEPIARAAAAQSAEVAPGLTVVKLKPKKEAPPRLPTAVAVQEPPEEAAIEYSNLGPGGAVAGPGAELSAGEADPKLGEALFTYGLDKLKTGNIQGGVDELTRFADENPRHARADNALYFVAVGQMSLDDLPAAALTLERVLTRYPAGDVVLDANLKLAEVRARMKRPGEARVLYEKIVSEFPGTSAATTAQARLHSLAEASPNR